MLQQDEPEDFVIATGEEHSVREFVEVAFAHVGLDREPAREDGSGSSCARPRSTISSATPRRRATKLGWEPRVSFRELVEMMVDADLERLSARRDPHVVTAGLEARNTGA